MRQLYQTMMVWIRPHIDFVIFCSVRCSDCSLDNLFLCILLVILLHFSIPCGHAHSAVVGS